MTLFIIWLICFALIMAIVIGGTKHDELENNEIYLPENDFKND